MPLPRALLNTGFSAPAALACILSLLGCGSDPPPPPKPAPVETAAPAPAPPPPKPEPEEDMTISGSGVLGSLSDDQIQAPIQMRWNDIQRCKSSTKPPWYVGGQITLHFRVASTGDIKKLTIEDSTLGNWGIEKCILGIVRTLHFSHPRGGEAEFSYPIQFPARATVKDWEQAQISPDMLKHRKEVAECGKGVGVGVRPPPFKLTVYLGAGGKVTSAGMASAEPIDEAFADCVVARASKWKFTDPLGIVVRASYQFQ